MSLFKLGKKIEESKCCCNSETHMQKSICKCNASIKILGGGCSKCNQLEKATIEALKELNMDTTIYHVKDFEEIASYGVMSTPALVVDDKVVAYGKVLKKDEVVRLIKGVRG